MAESRNRRSVNEEDRLMPEETVLCKQDKLASSLILALTLDFPPPQS